MEASLHRDTLWTVHQSQSHIAADGKSVSQSVSLGINLCLTVTVLSMWGALSDGRTGLAFVRYRQYCTGQLSYIGLTQISYPIMWYRIMANTAQRINTIGVQSTGATITSRQHLTKVTTLVIKEYAMKTKRGRDCMAPPFLSSSLVEVIGRFSLPVRFTPGERAHKKS
jgi:hypothetical protein